MGSIIKEVDLTANAEVAWAALRDVAEVHKAFPGVIESCNFSDGVRILVFANGLVLNERIVTIDEPRRRVVYAVIGGPFSHHNASMQITAMGEVRSRFTWVSDFLPDSIEPTISPLIDELASALQQMVVVHR